MVGAELIYLPCTVRITGAVPGSAPQGASKLTLTSPDVPAILIQAGHSVVIENLQIVGPNNWQLGLGDANAILDAMFGEDGESALYLEGPIRDTRTSPSAGIAIDPFPQSSLPDPSDKYPGLESLYLSTPVPDGHSAKSTGIQIRDCYIGQFAVGVAVSLSGDGNQLNCENIAISNCVIASTKTGIALGQSQSKAVTLRDISVNGALIAINCVDYGLGTAPCPSIFGANMGNVKYIFRVGSSGSGAAINGLYAESVLSLGFLGGSGSASDPIAFSGCRFGFCSTPTASDHSVSTRTPSYHLANLTQASFDGCQFSIQHRDSTKYETMWFQNLGWLAFRSCVFTGHPMEYTEVVDGVSVTKRLDHPPFWISTHPERATFDNCRVEDAYNADPAVFSQIMPVDTLYNVYDQAMIPGALFYTPVAPFMSLRWVASGYGKVPLGTVDVTVGASTATFDLAGAGEKLRRGDLIESGTPYYPFPSGPNGFAANPAYAILGQVRSVSGNTVTLEYVPDYIPLTGGSPVPHTLSLRYLPRVHYGPTTAGATTGSSTITPSVFPSSWKPNQRITVANATTGAAYTSAGTYITRFDGTSIHLSAPLTGTATGCRVYDADVRELSNTKL